MLKWLAVWMLLAVPALAMGGASESPLAAYQWQKRVLVLFAPEAQDQRLGQQMRNLMPEMPGMLERDLVIVQVAGDDVIDDGVPSARLKAVELRAYYDVKEPDFAVRLVGKDGGVKLERSEPVAVPDLFGLIDSMPMRQREMREVNN